MEQPKHIDKQTPDGAALNLNALYQIAPSCFTEAMGEDGELRRVVDFEKLRMLLGDNAVENAPEVYDFTWVGKRAALHEAAAPINKTLRPCPKESVNWDTTQNLYIEGDNLEVLKLLQNSYMGKVKMVYIDPPYNTGKDFVYHDDFYFNDENEHLNNEDGKRLLSTKQVSYDGKLVRNTDSNGRFHSDWCSMMYARLMVARSLLKEDGVIFISIDDNEQENLKKICDEIFGRTNFIGQLVLKTATDNNPSQINVEHEYMFCYAKNKMLQPNWSRQSEAANKIVQQYKILKQTGISNDEIQIKLRKWIKDNKDSLPQVTHYNNVDDKGVYSNSSNSSNPHPGGYMFNIIHPQTKMPCPKPANGWRWPETTFLAYDKIGEIEWGKDHTTQPHVKKRIETSVEYLRTLIYEDNRATTKMLSDLFDGYKVFDNPKPINVLSRLIEFITDNTDIILDFFSGSSSTAHAVMQLNTKDGGNRKFIMVQLPEETDKKSEAHKAGYKNICEIGKERIRRAGKKIREELPLTTQDLDTGFRVFKCESSNYKDVVFAPKDYSQETLDLFVDNIKDDRTDLDLLFDCMLRWGVELSLPLSNTKVDDCTIHNVNDGDLVACFSGTVTENVIDAIAELSPLRVVFRDSSFEEAAQKMNLFELFKQRCGWTDEEVRNNVRVI